MVVGQQVLLSVGDPLNGLYDTAHSASLGPSFSIGSSSTNVYLAFRNVGGCYNIYNTYISQSDEVMVIKSADKGDNWGIILGELGTTKTKLVPSVK